MTYPGFPEILANQWACYGFNTALNALMVTHRRLRSLQMGAENKALYLTMNTAYCISNAVMLMEENKSVRQRDENPTTEATKQQ